MRQAIASPQVRGYAVTHPSGVVVLPQPRGWDQLLYAATGVMTVETGSHVWVVPPHRALWIPSGTGRRLRTAGRVAVRSLYFAADLEALPPRCRAVSVPPLLRELVLHAVLRAPLDLAEPRDERLVGVIVDQLEALPDIPLQLPWPRDPRARAFAESLTRRPDAPLDALASQSGASRRTIERCFRAETGLTVGQWRERHRLAAALRLLAEGHSATTVALQVGYATPSAFGAMFKRVLGTSPKGAFPCKRPHEPATSD